MDLRFSLPSISLLQIMPVQYGGKTQSHWKILAPPSAMLVPGDSESLSQKDEHQEEDQETDREEELG